MERKFPLGSFNREKRTTFSDASFIPENFHWNEPKIRVAFKSQTESPECFGKLKTLFVSRNFFSCLLSGFPWIYWF